ncbi:hypothetical protein KI743_07065 [Vibrio sp. D420a]|jgi:hypothetical protein|uniref:hypothetical protein n=1 Tax=unclassified Vibrio TaxID=2614977 RepID=UPI001268AD62|nr:MULTISPECIES: hypothetical protein [unclassified Vibrio]MDK9761757.1 hypothetical protein [Vibrio sp. D420a]|tara:strand:+ start:162 stop:539 length:378 start_codon:yes stop_codon:yes gene_type:complete
MKTLYQLSDSDFEQYLLSIKPIVRRSAKSQREIEQVAIEFGYQFTDSYHYQNQTTKVSLLCPSCNHIVFKQPRSILTNPACPSCKVATKTKPSNNKATNRSIRLDDLISTQGSKKLAKAIRDSKI